MHDPGGKNVFGDVFSSDTVLATGDSAGPTYLWNIATGQLIATLTGRHHSDISKDTTRIRTLLTALGRPLPAAAPRRIRTLADLRQHARTAGITIPEPAPHSPAQ